MALGLVKRLKRSLREADYVRSYLLDERFRALSALEDSGRYVTYFCYAGLANRFRSHYAASVIANKTNRNVIPIWIQTMHLRSDSTDVFEQRIAPVSSILPH